MTPWQSVNTLMPTYRYHIVDAQGTRVESNIPDRDQAETYRQFLVDKYPYETYSIEQERIYTVRGMGRDPDLHWTWTYEYSGWSMWWLHTLDWTHINQTDPKAPLQAPWWPHGPAARQTVSVYYTYIDTTRRLDRYTRSFARVYREVYTCGSTESLQWHTRWRTPWEYLNYASRHLTFWFKNPLQNFENRDRP